MAYSHLKLRYACFYFQFTLRFLNLTQFASYVLVVSHSSAISSRTTYSCAEQKSLYIAVVTGRLCCTHQLVLSNANLCNLYIIILHKPGGAFSSEPHHCFFLQARSDRKMRPQCCSIYKVDMFCLVAGCCCPTVLYSMEINFMSIFMSLNIAICGYMRIKK